MFLTGHVQEDPSCLSVFFNFVPDEHLHCSHLADALIQSDLQEHLGLSDSLKGTSTD